MGASVALSDCCVGSTVSEELMGGSVAPSDCCRSSSESEELMGVPVAPSDCCVGSLESEELMGVSVAQSDCCPGSSKCEEPLGVSAVALNFPTQTRALQKKELYRCRCAKGRPIRGPTWAEVSATLCCVHGWLHAWH
jgi:hypothetical protein